LFRYSCAAVALAGFVPEPVTIEAHQGRFRAREKRRKQQ